MMLAAQIERDQLIALQTDELAQKSSLLKQAEANAAEEKRRAISELREHEDRLLAHTSLGDEELVDAKLDESLLSPGQQIDADNGWADELHTVSAASLIDFDLNESQDMYELKGDKHVMEAELAMECRNEG